LLRGGFARCGFCNGSLTAFTTWDNAAAREAGAAPRLRYHCTRNVSRPGICYDGTRNTISARVLDRAVWAGVETILRDPERIRRKLEELQQTDPTAAQREQLERQLLDVEDMRKRAADAITAIADEHVSAPLIVSLREFAARADDILEDLAKLEGQRRDWEHLQAHLTRLEAYARRVSTHTDRLTYDQQRKTLYALNVRVRVWKPGTHTDENGTPIRWECELEPFGERAIHFSDVDAAELAEDPAREPAPELVHTAANRAL
jgi:hypothetical protein